MNQRKIAAQFPSKADFELVRHDVAAAIGALRTAFDTSRPKGEDPLVRNRLFELAVQKLNGAVGQLDRFCGR